MLTETNLYKYEPNVDTQSLKFEDPFELCLKAKWTKRRRLIGVENGVVMAVSDDDDLLLEWHRDEPWIEGEYPRIFSWKRLAKEYIACPQKHMLMFATLFIYAWFPEQGDDWLGPLDVLAREVS